MKSRSITFRTWSWILLAGLSLSSAPLPAQSVKQGVSEPGPPAPFAIVSKFLELSDTQILRLIELRREAEPQFREIQHEIKMLEERLGQEVESEDPDSSLIGELVLHIRSLHEEAGHTQQQFVETFAEGLDEEQQGRLHLVLQAAHLQQILPTFHAVGLLR